MKILVIDDDNSFANLLKEFLESLDHTVTVVHSAEDALSEEDALRILKAKSFDVILCDWVLTGMDGLEFCKKVRARNLGLNYPYFILLTGQNKGKENYLHAMDAGADDFLSKPMDMELLKVRLKVAERICKITNRLNQLESYIPTCAYCKRVRRDDNIYEQLQDYVSSNYKVQFSHGICPDCLKKESGK